MQSLKFVKQLNKNNRYIQVTEWDGEPRIDIRQWAKASSGKLYPLKTGVSLTLSRWKMLCMHMDDIEEGRKAIHNKNADVDLQIHLGGNFYASLKYGYPCVDIRKFWIPDGQEKLQATQKGIALLHPEWDRVVSYIKDIELALPELAEVTPCPLREDHQNQEGMLQCSECNPNYCQDI